MCGWEPDHISLNYFNIKNQFTACQENALSTSKICLKNLFWNLCSNLQMGISFWSFLASRWNRLEWTSSQQCTNWGWGYWSRFGDEPKTHFPLPKLFGFFTLFFTPKVLPRTYLPPPIYIPPPTSDLPPPSYLPHLILCSLHRHSSVVVGVGAMTMRLKRAHELHRQNSKALRAGPRRKLEVRPKLGAWSET